MFHVWFLPVLVIVILALVGLYLAIRCIGGDGVRKDGHCVCDEKDDGEVDVTKHSYVYLTKRR